MWHTPNFIKAKTLTGKGESLARRASVNQCYVLCVNIKSARLQFLRELGHIIFENLLPLKFVFSVSQHAAFISIVYLTFHPARSAQYSFHRPRHICLVLLDDLLYVDVGLSGFHASRSVSRKPRTRPLCNTS